MTATTERWNYRSGRYEAVALDTLNPVTGEVMTWSADRDAYEPDPDFLPQASSS